MRRALCIVALVVAANASPATATTEVFFPTPYLSFADSPFSGLGLDYFHLEDFEDGLLNTPGASVSGGEIGVVPPYEANDSVDADDGVIDGSGNGGRTWYSKPKTSEPPSPFRGGAASRREGRDCRRRPELRFGSSRLIVDPSYSASRSSS